MSNFNFEMMVHLRAHMPTSWEKSALQSHIAHKNVQFELIDSAYMRKMVGDLESFLEGRL